MAKYWVFSSLEDLLLASLLVWLVIYFAWKKDKDTLIILGILIGIGTCAGYG